MPSDATSYAHREPFSLEKTRRYVFKSAVGIQSYTTQSKLAMAEEYREVSVKEAPMFYHLMFTMDQVREAWMIDFLAELLVSEKNKSSYIFANHEKGTFRDLSKIPEYPYITESFLESVELAYSLSLSSMEEKTSEAFKRGYGVFVSSLKLLITRVFPPLFSYLRNENKEVSMELFRQTQVAYNDFLRIVHQDKDLDLFCNMCVGDNILKQIMRQFFSAPTESEKISFRVNLATFKSSLLGNHNSYYQIGDREDEVMFVPIGFSSPFVYYTNLLFASSPLSIIVNQYNVYRDVLETEGASLLGKDKPSLEDMRLFFLYKMEHYLPAEDKDKDYFSMLEEGDKLLHGAEDDSIVEVLGSVIQPPLREKIRSGLKSEDSVIALITKSTEKYMSEVKKEAIIVFGRISKEKGFKYKRDKYRILTILSIVRSVLFRKKDMAVSIHEDPIKKGDSFYAKIQRRIIEEGTVEITRELVGMLADIGHVSPPVQGESNQEGAIDSPEDAPSGAPKENVGKKDDFSATKESEPATGNMGNMDGAAEIGDFMVDVIEKSKKTTGKDIEKYNAKKEDDV